MKIYFSCKLLTQKNGYKSSNIEKALVYKRGWYAYQKKNIIEQSKLED